MTRRDRTTGPEGMRLYYMLGAMLHFDQSVFTHMLGMGNTIAVPTPIFLIDHPEGKVLFETGVHRDVVTDAVGHWGEHVLHGNTYVRGRDWAPQLTADNLVENQLSALGISTDDIRYVVQSVLIPDHAGGVRAFPKSTIIVQYRELQDAWNPPTFMPYHYDQNELCGDPRLQFPAALRRGLRPLRRRLGGESCSRPPTAGASRRWSCACRTREPSSCRRASFRRRPTGTTV